MQPRRNGNTPDASWLALVVDEGQPGMADGVLVHVNGYPVLIADDGVLSNPQNAIIDTPISVPLVKAATPMDFTAWDGRRVVAAGTLRNQALHVDSVDPAPNVRPAASDNPANEVSRTAARVERRLPAERDLMEQGVLLDAWTDERTNRRIALTTAPSLIEERLRAHYPDSLQIVESRWDHRYLASIRAKVPDDILLSFGNTIGGDNQIRLALTLLHLPSKVARHLSQHPAEALDVQTLIRPPAHVASA